VIHIRVTLIRCGRIKRIARIATTTTSGSS
jgi:hypothetical protein